MSVVRTELEEVEVLEIALLRILQTKLEILNHLKRQLKSYLKNT